jgi:hypothetical protein
MPLPSGLVVKNALKIWSAFPLGNPTPVSLTEIRTRPLIKLRLDGKYSACLRHRLDAVEHKVHENLLQLHTICHDFGEPFGTIGADIYGMPIRLIAEDNEYLSDDFVHINYVHL